MAKKFKNWDEVDNALKKLAELEYQKTTLENEKNLKVNTYESTYNEGFAPIAQEMADILQNINSYLEEKKAEFETVKTKKLPNGTISCKASNKIEIPDEGKTMELLRKLKLTHCITVSESLNKNVLKALDEKTLKQAKVNIVKENKFTIKTNQTELRAVTTA